MNFDGIVGLKLRHGTGYLRTTIIDEKVTKAVVDILKSNKIDNYNNEEYRNNIYKIYFTGIDYNRLCQVQISKIIDENSSKEVYKLDKLYKLFEII